MNDPDAPSDQDGIEPDRSAEIAPTGEGASPPPSELDELPEEQTEAIAEQVTRAVMMQTSWVGRLPPPEALDGYDRIVPGSAHEIVQDMLQESRLAQQSIDIDRQVSQDVIGIMNARHELRVEESRDDRVVRTRVFEWLRPIFYLPLGVIVLVMYSGRGDWAVAAIIIAILAAYVAPLCLALSRGRVTDNERDVITSIVPQITAAVTGALSRHDADRQRPSANLSEQDDSKRLEGGSTDEDANSR